MNSHLFDFVSNLSGPWPYVFVFILLMLCGFGLPMPEDIILFIAGMLSYYQKADVRLMILTCFLGVIIGDSAVFLLGNYFGPQIRKFWFYKKILPPKRRRIVRKKLHEQGPKVIFSARFMPGLRMPVFFTAGTLHLRYRTFFFYDGLAALISVPAIVFVVFHFGYEVDRIIRIIKRVQFGVIATIVLLFAGMLLKAYIAHKKERELEQ